jgi:hypothetical protein
VRERERTPERGESKREEDTSRAGEPCRAGAIQEKSTGEPKMGEMVGLFNRTNQRTCILDATPFKEPFERTGKMSREPCTSVSYI